MQKKGHDSYLWVLEVLEVLVALVFLEVLVSLKVLVVLDVLVVLEVLVILGLLVDLDVLVVLVVLDIHVGLVFLEVLEVLEVLEILVTCDDDATHSHCLEREVLLVRISVPKASSLYLVLVNFNQLRDNWECRTRIMFHDGNKNYQLFKYKYQLPISGKQSKKIKNVPLYIFARNE